MPDYPRSVRRFGPSFLVLILWWSAWLAPPSARAQSAAEGADLDPEMEEPDETRLDVERLPPEAIELDRDLYAHGFFIDTGIGGRGFFGGVGEVSKGGPYLQVGLGYELVRWLWLRVGMEASMHSTDAPAPPTPGIFEILGAQIGARFQWDVNARAALFLGGEFGIVFVTDDILRSYGFNEADELGITYGGELGFDWHLRNRHHSFGFLGGARAYPSLEGFDGTVSVGVHGAIYLRYVFGG